MKETKTIKVFDTNLGKTVDYTDNYIKIEVGEKEVWNAWKEWGNTIPMVANTSLEVKSTEQFIKDNLPNLHKLLCRMIAGWRDEAFEEEEKE